MSVLKADAFFARIEPYKRIFAIALPPDFSIRANTGNVSVGPSNERDTTATASSSSSVADRPCAKCWGISSSNEYLNLARAHSVVMIRGDSIQAPPVSAIARALGRSASELGGVLFTTTRYEDVDKVTQQDAERIAVALRSLESFRESFRDVPFGFWDGPQDEGSWRAASIGPPLTDEDDDEDAPAAAIVARNRLQKFLESTQGALNTFG
jgi:hypothetical protein